MNKKGDGLSMNMIVLAVIAILVLVVISFMVIKGAGNFNNGINSCAGPCVDTRQQCMDQNLIPTPSGCKTGSGQSGGFCCVSISK